MRNLISSLTCRNILIDANSKIGLLKAKSHSFALGGIDNEVLPDYVVNGIKKLEPEIIRIVINEYFNIYPEHGKFNWSKLDEYIAAVAKTGTKIIAAISIKPSVLFPEIKQNIWYPNDIDEWKNVIYQIVQRYSVDNTWVTYWEIGNEPNLGAFGRSSYNIFPDTRVFSGGSPYLIKDPKEYFKFFNMMIKPVLEAFPSAKVGGPAVGGIYWDGVDNDFMPDFIKLCDKNGTRLDFISWHFNSDVPESFITVTKTIHDFLDGYHGKKPELMITEWNKSFREDLSIEELSYDPKRAALTVLSVISMLDAGIDRSFYYQIWDQIFHPKLYNDIVSDSVSWEFLNHYYTNMPHRFGLFSNEGIVRPQFFAFWMLYNMGDERLECNSDTTDLKVLASKSDSKITAMVVNYNAKSSHDMVFAIDFTNLTQGLKRLTVYRIDEKKRWSSENIELIPVEQRIVEVRPKFHCQVYSPEDSVSMVILEDYER